MEVAKPCPGRLCQDLETEFIAISAEKSTTTTFWVHKNLLFKAVNLERAWRAGKLKVSEHVKGNFKIDADRIHLLDVRSDTLKVYVRWMYTNDLRPSSTEDGKWTLDELMNLHIFWYDYNCRYGGDSFFGNDLCDAFQDYFVQDSDHLSDGGDEFGGEEEWYPYAISQFFKRRGHELPSPVMLLLITIVSWHYFNSYELEYRDFTYIVSSLNPDLLGQVFWIQRNHYLL